MSSKTNVKNFPIFVACSRRMNRMMIDESVEILHVLDTSLTNCKFRRF